MIISNDVVELSSNPFFLDFLKNHGYISDYTIVNLCFGDTFYTYNLGCPSDRFYCFKLFGKNRIKSVQKFTLHHSNMFPFVFLDVVFI